MCLAQGPQRSDAVEARTRGTLGLESSALCAPIKLVKNIEIVRFSRQKSALLQ